MAGEHVTSSYSRFLVEQIYRSASHFRTQSRHRKQSRRPFVSDRQTLPSLRVSRQSATGVVSIGALQTDIHDWRRVTHRQTSRQKRGLLTHAALCLASHSIRFIRSRPELFVHCSSFFTKYSMLQVLAFSLCSISASC